MANCILTQIRPILLLAKILGLNWFDTHHHHNCLHPGDGIHPHPPTTTTLWKHCEVRSTSFFSFGSILNAILLGIGLFCTYWITVNVNEFISQFFTGVEQFTYTGYITLYYWQTPPLLLIPRFTFRALPQFWDQYMTISNKLKGLLPTGNSIKEEKRSKWTRLTFTCWTLALITLGQGLAYMVFFLIVVHSLCTSIKAKQQGDCFSGVYDSIGINLSVVAFFVVCVCPQIVAILFFLHCFLIKRLLHRLGRILHQTLTEGDNSPLIPEREKCQRILALRLLYVELVDVVGKIGKGFGLQILIIFISSILSLTVAAYIMFLTTLSKTNGFYIGELAGAPLLALLGCQLYFALFTLSFLLGGGNMVKKEGDNIHKILHRARHETSSGFSASDMQFQITMFQNSDPTIVSVYGITTVEMKIITAMVANVITYFMILVQLKISLELTRPDFNPVDDTNVTENTLFHFN